jgi:hypothetical protein
VLVGVYFHGVHDVQMKIMREAGWDVQGQWGKKIQQ